MRRFEQTDRPLRLTTPLPADDFVVMAVQGREAVSELYQFEVQAAWQPADPLDFSALLGQKVTLTISLRDGKRYFNGIVAGIAQEERDRLFTHYRITIVPSLWLLTRVSRCRIYQNKDVPEIVKSVIRQCGQPIDLDPRTTATYQPREYCVQYNETDFQFISRLLEEEGIYYYFKFTESNHTMVWGDALSAFSAVPYSERVVYEGVEGRVDVEERIHEWVKTQGIRSGKYSYRDYNFETPQNELDASSTIKDTVMAGSAKHKLQIAGNQSMELYRYPGEYMKTPLGDSRVKVRMEQEALPSLLIRGLGTHPGFTAGHTFEIDRHFSDNGKYALTSVEHDATQPLDLHQATGDFKYTNNFNAIPYSASLPFRPLMVTPHPSVRGVQTAVVVGPSGEEIYTDEYGRIKVQFHWDRDGQSDANSSCWLRVATPWAGKQWGALHIPRIGQEVVVDFVDGDPDRPIVIGSVYNADQMPPFSLPDNKTQSGLRSRSSKGGGADNFNEIRLEDLKGSELMFVHAEKDLLTEVEHDETRTVGHDRTTTIKNNETKEVTEGDETQTVKKGNRTMEVSQGNQSTTIKMGNLATDVQTGNVSMKLGQGDMSTKVDSGKSEQEAAQSIELKVGSNSIKIDQMGVTIKGMMISIEAQVQMQVKGLMTEVDGSAMLTAKGGVVMIN
jgi:type VI secretion system secreted protein VgrG